MSIVLCPVISGNVKAINAVKISKIRYTFLFTLISIALQLNAYNLGIVTPFDRFDSLARATKIHVLL